MSQNTLSMPQHFGLLFKFNLLLWGGDNPLVFQEESILSWAKILYRIMGEKGNEWRFHKFSEVGWRMTCQWCYWRQLIRKEFRSELSFEQKGKTSQPSLSWLIKNALWRESLIIIDSLKLKWIQSSQQAPVDEVSRDKTAVPVKKRILHLKGWWIACLIVRVNCSNYFHVLLISLRNETWNLSPRLDSVAPFYQVFST